MDIRWIDKRRRGCSLSVVDLCDAAGISHTTYFRLLKRPGSGRASTLRALVAALMAREGIAARTGAGAVDERCEDAA